MGYEVNHDIRNGETRKKEREGERTESLSSLYFVVLLLISTFPPCSIRKYMYGFAVYAPAAGGERIQQWPLFERASLRSTLVPVSSASGEAPDHHFSSAFYRLSDLQVVVLRHHSIA